MGITLPPTGDDVVTAAARLLGGPSATARYLTEHAGRAYTRQEVWAMREGRRPVPEAARYSLSLVVLHDLLGDSGPRVARALAPPQKRNQQ